MSAARASARAVTSLDDGAADGSEVIGGVRVGAVERDPAGEVPEDPPDAPGVQAGLVADLLAGVPEPAEVEDGPVLVRAGGEQGVPRRCGPGVLARPVAPARQVAQGHFPPRLGE